MTLPRETVYRLGQPGPGAERSGASWKIGEERDQTSVIIAPLNHKYIGSQILLFFFLISQKMKKGSVFFCVYHRIQENSLE